LQGFAQIVRAFAQFLEQARILDSDDGLFRETLDQCNLFGRERSNLLANDRNRAHQIAFLQHGHHQ
jgi:hypothetical protein